ncbi:type II toxin-antitoxin system RelE/ParE family toxin [Sphingomonas koreensis]|nr:type II toxin-antitoxin system RelE/ParE family toxin [Sphingomonas koreensis]
MAGRSRRVKLLWSMSAERDLDRLWQFLADRSVDLADRIEERIRIRAESLIVMPHQGRPIPGRPERELPIPDVQYVIVYAIGDDAIRILRVWSTRQNREEP